MIPELQRAVGHGPVHFIGIGGISMSGLAQILLDQGIPVTGSDRTDSPVLDHLRKLGAHIGVPHDPALISTQTLVVYTAAISEENAELVAARQKGLPLMDRGHFLGLLARGYARTLAISGTHGKTTSTGMTACILLEAQTDPTIHIGGMLPAINGNTRSGGADWFLMEACEYKNSYHSFFPTHTLVLNIEADHLDFFRDLEDILDSFSRFTDNLTPDGTLVLNLDDSGCCALAQRLSRPYAGYRVEHAGLAETDAPEQNNHTPVPHGVTPIHSYLARNIREINGAGQFEIWCDGVFLTDLTLSIPGHHNIQNATGCFALAHLAGLPAESIARGLSRFTGTGRRFERRGHVHGALLVDDYAHHPSEIRATLAAARQICQGRVLCVFQPHTYTRTRELFSDFSTTLALADQVVLVDIYAAREPNLGQVHSRDLVLSINNAGGLAQYAASFSEAVLLIQQEATPKDIVLVMGAGDVSHVADMLASDGSDATTETLS